MANRPKIDIELNVFDRFVEAFGFLAILLLIGIPSYYYGGLPEIIPTHYGLNGEPDGFSGKGMIWTLPLIGTVMFAGLFILSKFPHIFNYAVTITEENAEKQYRIATKMIRTLNTLIAIMFCYLTWSTVQTSFGNQSGLGSGFLIVFNVSIFGVLAFFIIQSFRNK